MEVAWALFAREVSASPDGGINLMGVFSRITAAAAPHREPAMVLAMMFRASGAAAERGDVCEVRVRILDEEGDPAGESGIGFDIAAAPNTPGMEPEIPKMIGMEGWIFPRFGTYYFTILIDGEVRARVPLTLLPASAPLGLDSWDAGA